MKNMHQHPVEPSSEPTTNARSWRRRGERGASLVEYALLVALIAVVCIGAVTYMGMSSKQSFDKASGADVCPPNTHLVPSSELPFTTTPQDAHLTGWCLPD